MPVIEGCTRFFLVGNITAGVDEIQTLTISAASGSTFKLKSGFETTAAIAWSSDNATLVAAIDTALQALTCVGSAGVTCATASMTLGVGTITATFDGANMGGTPVETMSVPEATLTGANATVTVAKTTTGIAASFRGAKVGALLATSTAAASALYMNRGTAQKPSWLLVGTQS